MSIGTKNPTVNTTPDPVQGGIAVTGNSNTGHGSTNSTASRNSTGATTQLKTCIWTTFLAGAGQIKRIDLKFSWTAVGTTSVNTLVVGDSGSAAILFTVDYSLNNGGVWTNKVEQTIVTVEADGDDASDNLNTSGSETVSIPVTTPLTQVQVRDFIEATVDVTEDGAGAVTADADITVTISDIRLEVTLIDGSVIAIM